VVEEAMTISMDRKAVIQSMMDLEGIRYLAEAETIP
jgi:hypothetical protein